jgi:alpha-1,4-digalacturonate transport system substrate-binding protein
MEITYPDDQYAFDLYNAEIAASPAISAVQTTDGLRFGYEGRSIDSEPLKDETVRYLNGEISLDETVTAINETSTAQMGD